MPNSCHLLKAQVGFPSNLVSIFSAIKRNSTVNFKLVYFLLWPDRFYQSSNSGKFNFVILETANQFFFKFCITLQCHETTPLYFFSCNFIYFQQMDPMKVEIWWNFTGAVESLKFCSLMGFFCPNHVKFQLKKVQKSYLWKHRRVM